MEDLLQTLVTIGAFVRYVNLDSKIVAGKLGSNTAGTARMELIKELVNPIFERVMSILVSKL